MLRTRSLNGGYGELQVIFDINAAIKAGKITAVLGPNGSGKSTFLKAISGLATVYRGEIRYDGRDITRMPSHRRARLGIAYLPQTDNLFSNLTVAENLRIAGYTLGEDKIKERIDAVLDIFPELGRFMKRKAGSLSGGERQFLAIGSALIREAKMLLLDEPTAHLSPKLSEVIFNRILELNDRYGLTIALVEQNVKGALQISDEAYVLVNGQVAFEGRGDELLEGGMERYFIGSLTEPRL
ncbi:MAG TPA: ABC transporter ATP-binding protein [Candidatus Syntrophoarchaeum butanivorans]|uniref:ABC transporter ATP-binding protein n=1 Tax=Candidatus Syntropharchaeum butanivorans TaxID=1839936 RepID=A0A1F2P633_9EURY|nr:MAG: branched-chain amino acid ABC transporter ATP-binding protein [Candidatus Syntrophoarchaeum butanivorans]HEC57660.1 ABC transporter ATP-binding protein [Candidatus Syntrophoarchaeum butanivorans]